MFKRLLLLSLLFLIAISAHSQKYDMNLFEGIKPRNVGPGGMSGRVTAIDVVHENPDIMYVGTASGGLWKSEGGGVVWEPIFDNEKVASIGALAINQNNPDEIWVGTGEGNPRNSQTSGYGIYKSIDGGKNWISLGLKETRNIHRIFIHPDNSDVVYVGVQGSAWSDSEHRGVYKTTDGGKNWEKLLFVNNRTGVADMVIDPENPNKLIVGMWEFRRWPWFFKSGGAGSGMYVTYDGGKNWEKRTYEDGLPYGEIGKIGLAIAPSNTDVVYALIESKKNALYKSEDGGFKWSKVQDKDIGGRPFYYADLGVDSENEHRLYNVFSNVKVSNDGGKTFEMLLGWDRVHGDHHYWYVHPTDGSLIIDGNDGGMAISRDRGKTWRFVENLPVAQFYHIEVDLEQPYNILGGMQDNGSWRGPAYVWRKGGIRNGYWEEIAFGDGFDVIVDHKSDRYGYGMSQGGNVRRLDFKTGASRLVKPTHPDGEFLRFNWNAAIAQDPFDSSIIYYGSQYVHKSTDEGANWEIISPDLTTNDPEKQKQAISGGLTYDVTGAENYTTIISIAPSPVEKGVIWAGTDDGNIQITKDGGKSWTNTVAKLKGFPKGAWVAQINPSTFNKGEAFAVLNDYRRGNWSPYLYHTKDYGKTWTNLVDENKVWGYALSFVQDPVESNLMFLGTEFGLNVSFDGGQSWNEWEKGYPTVSTMDMRIHPREHDLVIGTFGRSAWVIDDIRPLRALAKDGKNIWSKKLYTFEAPDAVLAHYKQAAGTRFHADAMFLGENRPYGAMISFYLKDLKAQEDKDKPAQKADTLIAKVFNASGKEIRELKVPAKKGINRFSWALDRAGVRNPGSKKPKPDVPQAGGPNVLPGTYTVTVYYEGDSSSTSVKVKNDPRLDIKDQDLLEAEKLVVRLMEDVTKATEVVDNLREAKSFLKEISGKASDKTESVKEEMKEKHKALKEKMEDLEGLFVPGEDVQGIFRDPALLNYKIGSAAAYVQGTGSVFSTFGTPDPVFYAPSEANKKQVEFMEKELNEALSKVESFFDTDWKAYTDYVKGLELEFVKEF
ncbi:MAG: hypothetical protein AAF363_15205 [Bacteroidota bacterium]